jgi:uncharacterized protein (TIGR02271 family)
VTQPPDHDELTTPTSGASIPVTEEQLEIRRRTVDSGRPVRVRKHVEDEAVRVEVPVARETVEVERVPIGRVVDEPPPVRREGDVTVVPVIEERLVTRKELVLVEEVRLTHGRQVEQVQEDVVLRRERVVVERFDPDTGRWLAERSSAPGN